MAYLSNVDIYYEMAEEAYKVMSEALQTRYVMSVDRKTMTVDGAKVELASKQAFIVIAFCAIHFEALVYIIALQKLGPEGALRVDRKLYEDRIVALGCPHDSLLKQAKHLREVRKKMVHEKAIDLEAKPDLYAANIGMAWDAAHDAVMFIRELRDAVLSS
ncbi:MAG: hypothetical protein ACTHNM_08065 [Dyella sp.]|uniref:hypothetical protein n=1 Tax=Dyella sp. TaxID=1869338 RepID=UPI003F8148EB